MNTAIVLLWIVGIIWSIALLAGIAFLIYQRGKSSTQENPNKGIIFTLNGKHLEKPKKAKFIEKSSKGLCFAYGKNDLVLVPIKYEEIYYRDRRLIFINNKGRLISDVFGTNGTNISDAEKETLIKEMLKANIGGGAVQAIKSTHPLAINIVMVVIALVVGVIGTYGFIQFQKQIGLNNQQQSQQIQPEIKQDVK